MHQSHHPLRSMISGTTCSVLREVRYRAISFHHAGTVYWNMHKEPTTRPQYGDAALNRTRKYQVLLVEDGRLRRKKELNSWWCIHCIGWMNSQYPRQSWICWLGIAHGSAHYIDVCVCQTNWNAPICADCKTVRTRHPALNQMMRRVQMGTLKNWLLNMIFKVILDITYDLSSWTLHVTCFFGHYMTCSLGHYVWLVFLDIMYDLLSWTLYYDLSSWTLWTTCLLDIIYDLSSWTLLRTRHLGHYIWLVILDILYDLSSWTLYMTCHIGHYFGLVILDIIIMAGQNGSFLRGWLPPRGKAHMACNYCFPTRTMF